LGIDEGQLSAREDGTGYNDIGHDGKHRWLEHSDDILLAGECIKFGRDEWMVHGKFHHAAGDDSGR
jgi:hypothetical protein